jgi:hypothetical protein
MQTHLTSFIICIAIHIFILLYTLLNAWKQRDFDFKKQFYSDSHYFSPIQNFLFVFSYILGIISNKIESERLHDDNVIKIFSIIFLFIFIALIIFSFLNLRKNQSVINLSYKSIICILVQSAISFSIATYSLLFSILFIFQIHKIFEDQVLEILTISFYILYTLIAITLLSKKEISYAIILVIIFIGCASNSYESELREFRDKELITLFVCIGTVLICILYMCVRYRKKIFGFTKDENIESLINNRFISGRNDPTI